MKQLIALAAGCLFITVASFANLFSHDKKPTKHRIVTDDKKDFLVLPDYKTGNAVISFKTEKAGKATIVVLNEDGSTVIQQEVKLTEGKNRISISKFTNLTEGYYTVCLNTTYKSWSAPFLLWK